LAMSSAVVPLGTSLVDPSGSLILITATSAEVWTVSDIIEPMYSAELFKFIGRAREGQTGGGHHVGPDALVRAGERSSPISGASLRRAFRLRFVDLPPICGASLRRAGEGTRPYVGSAGPPLRGCPCR